MGSTRCKREGRSMEVFCLSEDESDFNRQDKRMTLLESNDHMLLDDDNEDEEPAFGQLDGRSPSVILSPRDKAIRTSYYQKIGLVHGLAPEGPRRRAQTGNFSPRSLNKASSNPIPIAGQPDEFFSATFSSSVPVRASDVFLKAN